MSASVIIGFLKGLDAATAVIYLFVIIIAIKEGWIAIQGLTVGKKKKESLQVCYRGKSGACELVRHQMEKAEQLISTQRTKAIAIYMKTRKEKLGSKEGLAMDRDVHHYRATLWKVEQEIKDQLRYFFRENHLAEMSEGEFEGHAKKRTNEIIEQLTELLDLLYYPGSDPDRVELYDLNHKYLVPDIERAIYDAFREGRQLAKTAGDNK